MSSPVHSLWRSSSPSYLSGPTRRRGHESTLPTALRAAIPAGDPVTITYPYPTFFPAPTAQPLGWQMDSGYPFRLLGGYAHVTDANGDNLILPPLMNPSGLQRFLSGLLSIYGPPLPLSPTLVSITRTTLSRYDIRLVIVDRSEHGSGPVMTLFSEALGPPKLSSGHFSLWSVGKGKPGR